MKQHPQLSLLFVMQASPSGPAPLVAYLEAIPHVRVDVEPALPSNLSDYDVVITLGSCGRGRQPGIGSICPSRWRLAGRGRCLARSPAGRAGRGRRTARARS